MLQEEGGFLEHGRCSCRDLVLFCIQNHPVPTKNRERKHSQGICSWVLARAASALSRNQTAFLRWNLFGKRMTKSGYSRPEFQGHWHLLAWGHPNSPAAFVHEVFPRHPLAWLQFSPSFWKPTEAGKAPGRV